jgi:hypothetical protein
LWRTAKKDPLLKPLSAYDYGESGFVDPRKLHFTVHLNDFDRIQMVENL